MNGQTNESAPLLDGVPTDKDLQAEVGSLISQYINSDSEPDFVQLQTELVTLFRRSSAYNSQRPDIAYFRHIYTELWKTGQHDISPRSLVPLDCLESETKYEEKNKFLKPDEIQKIFPNLKIMSQISI